jgi:polysaccharide biosynthesis transport protein
MTPTQLVQIASDEQQQIVENLFLKNAAAKTSVVFTSPDRRAGCSWVVARIARTLAERAQGSVCVLDANLRWPSMHELFWLDNTRGFLQAIENVGQNNPIKDYTQRVQTTNLWILPSGGSVADSHSVLASQSVQSRIAELKREFDFVLIDTLAMKTSPDAGRLGRFADAVVLILAANATTREAAANSRIILEAANVPVAGAILNKRTYPIPDAIYQYL